MHGRLIACCVLHPLASQSDSTHPLFLFHNILFFHSICSRLQACNVLAHRNPPKGNSLCHTGLKGPFRLYTPRNVPLPSTVAPCVFVGVQPSSTVNLVLVSSLNFSVIAHIQIHLLNLQSSPRGRSRPPYMDFFLLICRRHESISYETPRLLVMISYPGPLLSSPLMLFIFREAFRHCIVFRMVGS